MESSSDVYVTDVSRPRTSEDPFLGRRKTLAGLDSVEWSFLVISLISVLGTVALTIYRLVDSTQSSQDVTFALVLLVNACFCTLYILNGIFRERQYELYMFIGGYGVVLGYCILEYAINVAGRHEIKLVRLVVGSVFAVPTGVLAVLVARQFGWLEFRIVGASESFQYMYRQTCYLSSLLNFDLQAEMSFLVIALRDAASLSTAQVVSLAVGLPFSLLWRVVGWLAVIRESKMLSTAFALTSVIEPAYVAYCTAKDYKRLSENSMYLIHGAREVLVYSTLVSGAIAILIRCITMGEFVIVYKNFGNGLKERAFPGSNEDAGLLNQQRGRRIRYT